jgi:hypothetical protein
LYNGNFRSVALEGLYWDFKVQTNLAHPAVTLTLADIQNLPADWEIVLLDKESRISLNFREQMKYAFVSSAEKTVRDFRIVVGKNDFVETNDLGLAGMPQEFALTQNYPNPFNLETRINYELPSINRVRIAIFNLSGQLVHTLFDSEQSAGRYTVLWDGTTVTGEHAASGIYLVRMEAGKFVAVKKAILTK